MNHAPLTATQIRRYFRDAAFLRVTLERNWRDFRWAAVEGKEIVYFVDADIVAFLLDPAKEDIDDPRLKARRYAKIFSDEDDLHQLVMANLVSSWLTAGRLAGQRVNENGNYRPLLVLPTHGEEVDRLVTRILDGAETALNEIHESSSEKLRGLRNELAMLVDGVSGGSSSYANLQKILFSLSDLDHREVLESVAFTKLISDNSIAQAVSMSFFDRRLLAPDESRVLDWCNRITNAKPRLQKMARGNRNSPYEFLPRKERERVKADAVALVQLLMLSEGNAGDDSRTRYVLITGDHGLHKAYAEWYFPSQANEHRKAHYVLRHPTQYIPLLNVNEMAGVKIAHDSMGKMDLVNFPEGPVREIRDALDTLLTNSSIGDLRYPFTLPFFFSEEREKKFDCWVDSTFNPHRDADKTGVRLAAVSDLWMKASQITVPANSGFLIDRIRPQAEALLGFIDRRLRDIDTHADMGALRRAGVRQQRELIAEVGRSHLSLSLRSSLIPKVLAASRSNGASRFAKHGSRATLAVLVDFGALTEGRPLGAFLEEILSDTISITQLNGLCDDIERRGGWDAWFFAACVAVRAGAWVAASFYAEKAALNVHEGSRDAAFDGTMSNGEADLELKWFRALTGRLALNFDNSAGFEQAHGLIVDCVTQHDASWISSALPLDGLKAARAHSELASLLLTRCYNEALRQDGHVPPSRVRAVWDRIRGDIHRLRISLDASANILMEIRSDLAEFQFVAWQIQRQVYVNKMILFLFGYYVFGFKSNIPKYADDLCSSRDVRGVLRSISEEATRPSSRGISYLGHGAFLVTQYTLNSNDEYRNNLRVELLELFTNLRDVDLPRFDQVFFDYFDKLFCLRGQ